jgi:hypothetical protein
MIKNRIRALLGEYEIQPTYTAIFGKQGRECSEA